MKNRIIRGDALEALRTLESGSAHTCVTSPPYWGLRDYGAKGQLGLEATPGEYVARLVDVFREVRRVLRDDGTLWLNLGDSYIGGGRGGIGLATTLEGGLRGQNESRRERVNAPKTAAGLKPKDLVGIPWRVAFALQADGWYLRSDIVWHKPNPMPESVTDRPTKSHEYIFLLTKSESYYYDADAVREPYAADSVARVARGRSKSHKWADGGPGNQTLAKDVSKACSSPIGRNRRTVWTVTTKPFKGAHFATFPPDLIEPCVLAGAPQGGVVLDPFGGSGTTGLVAARNGRRFVLIDLNPKYVRIAEKRIAEARA